MASGQQQGDSVDMAQRLLRSAFERYESLKKRVPGLLPSKRSRGGEVDESYKASFKDTQLLIKLDPLYGKHDIMTINLFDMQVRLPSDDLHEEVQKFRQFLESPDTVTEFDLFGRVGLDKKKSEIVKSRIEKSTSLTKVKINALWFKEMLDNNINMILDIEEIIDTVAKNKNIQVLNVYFKDLSDSNQLLQYSDYDYILKFFPTLQKIILKLKENIEKLEFENLLQSIIESPCFKEAFFEFLRKLPRTFGGEKKILEFKGLNTLTKKKFGPINLFFNELKSRKDFPTIMLDEIGGAVSKISGKKHANKKRPPAGAAGGTGPFTQSMQRRSPSDGGAGAAGGTRPPIRRMLPSPMGDSGAGAAGGTVGPPGSTTNPFGGGTGGVPQFNPKSGFERFMTRFSKINEPRNGPPEKAFELQGNQNLSTQENERDLNEYDLTSQEEGDSSEGEGGSSDSLKDFIVNDDTGVSEGEESEGLNTASRIGSLALSSKSSENSPAALAARCILHVV